MKGKLLVSVLFSTLVISSGYSMNESTNENLIGNQNFNSKIQMSTLNNTDKNEVRTGDPAYCF